MADPTGGLVLDPLQKALLGITMMSQMRPQTQPNMGGDIMAMLGLSKSLDPNDPNNMVSKLGQLPIAQPVPDPLNT